MEEKEKEDVVIESENNNSDNNNSNSESENIYFNSENEDDDQENEEFVAEENSDSDNEDESDPNKEPEVILRRSGRESRKTNDPLNINTTKDQSYTNIKTCVKAQKKSREMVKRVMLSDEEFIRKKEIEYNFFTQGLESDKYHEYSSASARVIGAYISEIKSKIVREGMSSIQKFSMRKGLKAFGRETGMKSMTKEIEQLHQRNSFKLINVRSMTDGEKARVQDAIMLLAQKDSENEVKTRLVYNGKETRKWLSREETASPTVSPESMNLTFAIDAHEERDVMIADVPNAFVQTCMPSELLEEDNTVIMKVKGVLVDILYTLDLLEYEKYIVSMRKCYIWC